MLPGYTNHVVIIIQEFHQLKEILYFALPAAGSKGHVLQSTLKKRSQYSVEFLHFIYSSLQLCTEEKVLWTTFGLFYFAVSRILK